MARDWHNHTEVLKLITDLLDKYADRNVAAFPLAISQENRPGKDSKSGIVYDRLYWTVDIHVHIPGVTEFTVEAEAQTLTQALRRAYITLSRDQDVIRRANEVNAQFGIAV